MSERKRRTEREGREERVRAALRWTEEVPPDVPAPTSGDGIRYGWAPLLGRREVVKAWSDSTAHGLGERERGGSQGARALYSTRWRALRGLRAALEQEAARALEEVDREIAAEERAPRGE